MPYYQRKNPRLPHYNYSGNGIYFITICTNGRKNILSHIVPDSDESYISQLTEYGMVTESVIKGLSERFPINVEKYVVMPNHVHIMIEIYDPSSIRAIRESPLQGRSLISKVIGYLKMNVSKQIHRMGYSEEVWQRSFHDHIIRNKRDYEKIWLYIEDNPRRWKEDCFYCEFESIGIKGDS